MLGVVVTVFSTKTGSIPGLDFKNFLSDMGYVVGVRGCRDTNLLNRNRRVYSQRPYESVVLRTNHELGLSEQVLNLIMGQILVPETSLAKEYQNNEQDSENKNIIINARAKMYLKLPQVGLNEIYKIPSAVLKHRA